ncbi:MAG: adenylate/guanylate cyclase domain-containing protein [Ignavibacteriales bacterium]|nr:adenylate/guanylate cyclase domain-containing protein [Ignavibacteriales bacterium]
MQEISLDYLTNEGTTLDYILNGITDGIYIVNKEKKIIFWNKGAQEITGYTQKEVLGYKCSEDILNHIDENGIALCKNGCPLHKTLTNGKVNKLKIFPLHKNGNRFPVKSHISAIKNKDGNIIGAIEVFRDISQEEELRVLQEKFNNLIKKYVSSATVESVMSQVLNGVKRTSKMRDLTILILDVVQFSTFSEKHSAEDAAALLNELFGLCELITKEYFGDIDKFIGDAIMAVFIDANDAVMAAEKILIALDSLNEKRVREKLDSISVRIAINSGQVIQAEIGTIERKELTVIGGVVNTASHIEKFCSPNSISITEATLARLKNASVFSFEKRIQVKGKKEPVSIFTFFPTSIMKFKNSKSN